MRILVVGPEAGGTRLMTGLLRQAGATVEHCSPMYRQTSWRKQLPHPDDFDRVVVVVRHGPWRERASMDVGHTPPGHPEIARWWAVEGLRQTLNRYRDSPVHIATLEALVHERDAAVAALCEDLGLDVDAATMRSMCQEIGDPNAKWYGGVPFRDDRPADARC